MQLETVVQVINDPLAQELLTDLCYPCQACVHRVRWIPTCSASRVLLEWRAAGHWHITECTEGACTENKPERGTDYRY